MKSLRFLNELKKEEVKAERCRRSFYRFFIEFWDTIESVQLVDNWHIKFICDELQMVYERWERGEIQNDLIINVPPGTSKSTIVTQLFPCWLWVKNASIRVITSSYADSLSTAHAVRSKTCIESDKFKLYFSDEVEVKTGENNKTWYKNTKMGERYATSTGGAVTGMHADFIIVDDPQNPKKAASETERQTAYEHITQTLSTRKTDKNRSVTIVVMQRLHEEDCTGRLLKDRNNINHICLPGEITDNIIPEYLSGNYIDGLLDINRLNRTALDTLKTNLGSYGYSGQILQSPFPEGGGLIKKNWFNIVDYSELKGGSTVNFFLDTAYTKDTRNDPTALMAVLFVESKLFIIDSTQVWLEFPELLKFVKSYAQQHGYSNNSRILVEPKATGKSIVQSFRNTGFNVVELPSPVDDKITRVSNISAFIESGKANLIRGQWNDNFLGECASFPNGSHDDQVDNLANAITYYTKNTGKIRSGLA